MVKALESARYMLARAQHHAADFEAHHEAFHQTNPYAHVVEKDANTGEEVHKMRFTKPIPPMLNGIASDALCNLRSALDQSTYAATKAFNSTARGKSTYFPFGEHVLDFQSRKNTGSCEVPDEIFRVIRNIEPYGRGKGAILWTMSQLCNANKHKILVPTATTLASSVGVHLMQGGKPLVRIGPRWDAIKQEIEVARMVPGMTAQYEMDVSWRIAFDDSAVAGRAVQDVLAEMIKLTSEAIDAIEAEGVKRGVFA